MNILHPSDALFLANAHLEGLRSAARAQARAAEAEVSRSLPTRSRRSTNRPMPVTRNVRQNTSERPSEVFCPNI